jgi:CheY-like chemotaxis protein
MDTSGKKILVVDDEEFNLDILNEYLQDAGFQTVTAKNGLEALSTFDENLPFDAIVLDRMMPIMDGMQFMKTVKGLEKYKNIPIIMQTAASSSAQIMEGIAAGVFYYLTKPYEKTTLLTILNAALEQHITHTTVRNELVAYKKAIKLLAEGSFNFRTLEEAKDLSLMISMAFPEPDKILFGLNELTVNAIEHGNLSITCEEKKDLLSKAMWQQEISNRLNSPQYSNKVATLEFNITATDYEITIKDMGKGFDHTKYLTFDPARLTDPNGRGIAMTKMYSFDSLEYKGSGNEVVCRVKR